MGTVVEVGDAADGRAGEELAREACRGFHLVVFEITHDTFIVSTIGYLIKYRISSDSLCQL